LSRNCLPFRSTSTLNTRQSKYTDTITTTNLPTHQTQRYAHKVETTWRGTATSHKSEVVV
jgi:hypothetical protein